MSFRDMECPATKEPCEFRRHCAIVKLVREDQDIIDELSPEIEEHLRRIYPAALLDAGRSSYCSEERIKAIGTAASKMLEGPGPISEGYEQKVRSSENDMVDTIVEARDQFYEPNQ